MDPTFLVKDQRAQKNLQRKHLNGNFNTKVRFMEMLCFKS